MSAEKDDDLASIGFAQNFMVIWNVTYAKESRCIHSVNYVNKFDTGFLNRLYAEFGYLMISCEWSWCLL